MTSRLETQLTQVRNLRHSAFNKAITVTPFQSVLFSAASQPCLHGCPPLFPLLILICLLSPEFFSSWATEEGLIFFSETVCCKLPHSVCCSMGRLFFYNSCVCVTVLACPVWHTFSVLPVSSNHCFMAKIMLYLFWGTFLCFVSALNNSTFPLNDWFAVTDTIHSVHYNKLLEGESLRSPCLEFQHGHVLVRVTTIFREEFSACLLKE